MPSETASTATSKSSPARRVLRPAAGPGGSWHSVRSPGSSRSWPASGRSGQHGSPPTRREGVVGLPARGQLGLAGQMDAVHHPPGPSASRSRRWKKRNCTPRRDQGLVERGEDHLAHPGLHPPEDRALGVEEHPGGQLQRPARRRTGAGSGRRPRRRRSGRTCRGRSGESRVSGAAPCRHSHSPVVEVVEVRPVAPGQQAVGEHAEHVGDHEVDEGPGASGRVVRGDHGPDARRARRPARPASAPASEAATRASAASRAARSSASSTAASAVSPAPAHQGGEVGGGRAAATR